MQMHIRWQTHAQTGSGGHIPVLILAAAAPVLDVAAVVGMLLTTAAAVVVPAVAPAAFLKQGDYGWRRPRQGHSRHPQQRQQSQQQRRC